MKSQICSLLLLCFLGTALAGSLSVQVRERRSVACSTCPTPSPAPMPTDQPPYPNNCPNKPAGLLGILQALVYLLINLFLNILDILGICLEKTGGLNILSLLLQLVLKIQASIGLMIAAPNSATASVQVDILLNDMSSLIAVIDDIKGDGTGHAWTCSKPTGAWGGLLTTALSLLLNLGINISLTAQIALCNPLLQVILSVCVSISICLSAFL